MADKFEDFAESLNSPPSRMASVTPSDSTDLPNVSRGINVATSGSVYVTTVGGDTDTVYIVAGVVFPLRAKRIWATGTTAENIVALF